MKILMTGGSSFTGFWFIKELAAQGHSVTAVVRGNKEQYTGLRAARVEQVAGWARMIWNCSFGDAGFLELLDESFDVVCHHGAQVENYKSPDFDISAAVQSNTLNTRLVMEKMKTVGSAKLVVTGSVFEANEGLGNPPLVAFSPYGLSKTASWEVFRYWSWKLSLPVTKFIIPNPFGPYEDPRFCNYLVQTWKKGEIPAINTPEYVRDNIHVDLLARHYSLAVERQVPGAGRPGATAGAGGAGAVAAGGAGAVAAGGAGVAPIDKYGPCGYVESQGAFGERFAREMAQRLPWRCAVRLGKQVSFEEPMMRTNDQLSAGPGLDERIAGWDEKKAWDELAAFYKS